MRTALVRTISRFISAQKQVPALRRLLWARRLSQAFFLALFLLAALHFGRLAAPLVGRSWPASVLRLFFQIDPLDGLLGALGRRGLVAGFWWLLPVALGTILLGRFFCGWVCPMGTLNHIFSQLRFGGKRGKTALARNHYRPWQKSKYFILTAGMLAALAGSSLLGWLDPLAVLQRAIGYAVLPAVHQASDTIVQATASALGQTSGRGLRILWAQSYLGAQRSVFQQSVGFLLLLAAILIANAYITRLWCRLLCPLGALLGALSRFSPLKLRKDESTCNGCSRCMLNCQGGDQPKPGLPWQKSECHLCLNCVSTCPSKSITFAIEKRTSFSGAAPDLNRRLLIGSAGAGLVALPVLHSTYGYASGANPQLIRPPGAAAEEGFLSRCVRCGNCIKACPTNALQPALSEGGLEGLWTPILVARTGYCAAECTLCTEVCPTGAIDKLTVYGKGWVKHESAHQPIRLGTAFFDHGRCLPWATGEECGFCEKACPVTPKAIYMEETEFAKRDGSTTKLKRPRIDLARCVGCGACEHFCTVRDRPAVAVSRIGESREPKGGLIVNGVDITGRSAVVRE